MSKNKEIQMISKEKGYNIIKNWKTAISSDFPISKTDIGYFIFIDGNVFVTIINTYHSECNVDEFDSLSKAIEWLNDNQ